MKLIFGYGVIGNCFIHDNAGIKQVKQLKLHEF